MAEAGVRIRRFEGEIEHDEGLRPVQHDIAVVDRSGPASVCRQRLRQLRVLLVVVKIGHVNRERQQRGKFARGLGVGQGDGEAVFADSHPHTRFLRLDSGRRSGGDGRA